MKPQAAAPALFAILAALAALGCHGAAPAGETAADSATRVVLAVSAAHVSVQPMSQQVSLIGTTAALRTLTLRAPTSGRVIGLEVTTGDSVRRGQVLAHIVNREQDAARAGAEAARQIDPAEANAMARAVKRYSSGPGIPVSAPENALVAQRIVNPGQIVNEFDPLVDLVDPESVYVDAQAPINQLGALKSGMDASVTSALNPGVSYPARIWSISPSFSAGGTTAPVWVQFTGPRRIAVVGAAVEVHVTIKSVPDAVVIPAAALFQDAARGISYVFTVGADGRAHRTIVVTAIRTAAAVQVTHGLEPGELVITSGGYALSDGLEVQAAVTPPAVSAGPQ
ncbi:MAG TPA: efflux RND transporter periplasmic adaptor subunit [Candidatus Binataceae bacterium]|nr:efflux RND transporter periplasmic adaptor subunit [Candidatus Binataceae bacterium]